MKLFFGVTDIIRNYIHIFFDKGYLTITPKSHIEISRRIKEEYDNGKYYYTLHGKEINRSERLIDQPSKEFLTWHNENRFKG